MHLYHMKSTPSFPKLILLFLTFLFTPSWVIPYPLLSHTHPHTAVSILKARGQPSGINAIAGACGWIGRQPISGTHRFLSAVYCCYYFHLSLKLLLTSVGKDVIEMMANTDTEGDRNQTNMARLWIEPPQFIVLVCRVYVLGPFGSVETVRRQKQSDVRDQRQREEEVDSRGGGGERK